MQAPTSLHCEPSSEIISGSSPPSPSALTTSSCTTGDVFLGGTAVPSFLSCHGENGSPLQRQTALSAILKILCYFAVFRYGNRLKSLIHYYIKTFALFFLNLLHYSFGTCLTSHNPVSLFHCDHTCVVRDAETTYTDQQSTYT